MEEIRQFVGKVNDFRDTRLPEPAQPVGYAALIGAYGLSAPLPLTLAAIGTRHKVYQRDGWRILTPRHRPAQTLAGHLVFALKRERLDLAVLKRLFLTIDPREVEAFVRSTPNGIYARRAWFLFDWLTGRTLDIPRLKPGAYIDLADPRKYWTVPGVYERRQRIRNNLAGTPEFCPTVARTPALERYAALNLAVAARRVIADLPADLAARTAASLLVGESRASFLIEGEHPASNRLHRWAQAIGKAGRQPLDVEELLRLQEIVMGDPRFVQLGLRREGGFIGDRDYLTREPLPVHISARAEDLDSLLRGLFAFDRVTRRAFDPVIAAAALAFGFVNVHPFVDGNGRLHRYLIHHALASRMFSPPEVVLPVSVGILADLAAYRRTLQSYSRRVLPAIRWAPMADGNVKVLNDTADFYRYFDATPHAEFLYQCVKKAVGEHLPNEADYLRRRDRALRSIRDRVAMPERLADQFLLSVRRNGGVLPRRRRTVEFAPLDDQEVEDLERIVRSAFE